MDTAQFLRNLNLADKVVSSLNIGEESDEVTCPKLNWADDEEVIEMEPRKERLPKTPSPSDRTRERDEYLFKISRLKQTMNPVTKELFRLSEFERLNEKSDQFLEGFTSAIDIFQSALANVEADERRQWSEFMAKALPGIQSSISSMEKNIEILTAAAKRKVEPDYPKQSEEQSEAKASDILISRCPLSLRVRFERAFNSMPEEEQQDFIRANRPTITLSHINKMEAIGNCKN